MSIDLYVFVVRMEQYFWDLVATCLPCPQVFSMASKRPSRPELGLLLVFVSKSCDSANLMGDLVGVRESTTLM